EYLEGDIARALVEPAQPHRPVIDAEIQVGAFVKGHAQSEHQRRLAKHRKPPQYLGCRLQASRRIRYENNREACRVETAGERRPGSEVAVALRRMIIAAQCDRHDIAATSTPRQPLVDDARV